MSGWYVHGGQASLSSWRRYFFSQNWALGRPPSWRVDELTQVVDELISRHCVTAVASSANGG